MSIADEARAPLTDADVRNAFMQTSVWLPGIPFSEYADAFDIWLSSRKPEAAPSDPDREALSPEAVEEHYGELILALSSSPDVSANHMRQFRLMIEAVLAEEREKTEAMTAEKEKWRKRCAEETLAWAEATKRADTLEAPSQPVQVEVTDDMVERAANAIERTWAGGRYPNATRQELNSARARAALSAALGGGE